MSPEEKAERDSKSVEAASRDSSGERRVRGVENNVDAMPKTEAKKEETVADRVAKTEVTEVATMADTTAKSKLLEVSTIADTTAKTELLTIEDTMAKLEIKKVEIIADVIPKTESKEVATVASTTAKIEVQEVETIADVMVKTEVVEITKRDTQEANVEASFETEVKLTEGLDIDTKMEEEDNAEINADKQDNTISENNSRSYELILTAGESKMEVSVENAHAEKTEHSHGSHGSPELSQSSSDNDEGGPSMFPMISMLKSAALSSDQVDEILDKVINVLTGEGHEVMFPEDRPSLTSSPEYRPRGQASTLRSQSPMLLNEKDLSDREIMAYANSIINIIMQKMHHDDDLYESAGGQKSLSPRRRSRPALNTLLRTTPKIPVLYIPKRADLKSLKSVDPKAQRVVLLEKHNHKMVTTGDLQVAPSQTYVPHTDDSFKMKLQEATVKPISDIIEHLSTNLLRSKSYFVPKKRWSSSNTLAKSISLNNLRCRAVVSVVAMDISSNVVEKLKEASGSSKTTCLMTSLRDFVRAMTVSHPGLSQQAASHGSKIHNVYREVLEMIVTKLRSFVTNGESFHNPREHLVQKMAESCLEVECAFMEILQSLKSHGTGDEACSTWAVDRMSTTISDTMFKHVTGGHQPQANTKPPQQGSTAPVKGCLNTPLLSTMSRLQDKLAEPPKNVKTEKQQISTIRSPTMETRVQPSHSISMNVTPQKMAKDVLSPKSCERQDVATLSGLRTCVGHSVQRRFTTESPSELLPRSKLKWEELIGMLCKLMAKSIISSLSLDSAFQVPVDAVSDTKESKASAVKLGTNTRTLVPTPPPRPTLTNSQKDNTPVQEDSRRTIRPLQAAKRVVSSMDLDISRTTSRSSGMVAQLGCPVKSNNSMFSKPPSPSSATSNTSLAASEVTENLLCKRLQGDSPDFMSSSSHTNPSPTEGQ
ncbi:unnamed protein product [Coregonus sp. 'balchen']|nr:unnamed protein product [Coregonus sp. 'balchen']